MCLLSFRRFLKRRGREEFGEYAKETDKAKIEKVLAEGRSSIAVIERTSSVYGMYEPTHPSVLGTK